MAARVQLDAALDFVRDGDVFMVTKLDRLARSTQHLLAIVDKLGSKGVALRVLNIGLDTASPTGKLMLTMLGAIGQFEREMMLERQKEGIAAAKAAGKYKGRAPTVRRRRDEINRLAAAGMGASEIAGKLGCHRASVYRQLET